MPTQATVVVFPGQGSQKVGMARDFHKAFAPAREVFAQASEALDLDMAQLCFEDGQRLALTEFTQPAILTAEIAMLRSVQDAYGFDPTHFAGHSLGEYTALVAAGALPLDQAVRIVRERGRLMQDAVPVGDGAMAAVIQEGVDPDALTALVDGLVVDLANVNSPDQIVISGATADIDTAVDRIEAASGRGESGLEGARCTLLKVSAPFHSRLMRVIEPGFRETLQQADWNAAAACNVAANTTGTFHVGDRDDLIDQLTAQISTAVRWDLDMQTLLSLDPARLVEIGPRRPLRAFFRAVGGTVDSVFNTVSARRAFSS